MTRPQIIRADTIDLQNQDAPSAKDHTRQPARPAPLGDGPPAPHQAETLKNVEQGAALEMHARSPRHSKDLSDKELQLLHEDVGSYSSDDGHGSNQELHSSQRNGDSGGMNGADGDMGDVDGDDGMDDDLLDKISSSPSIDDGGYPLPFPRISHRKSLLSTPTQEEEAPPLPPKHNDLSSPPFLSSPLRFPLVYPQKERGQPLSEDHHQKGGYVEDPGTLLSSKKDLELEVLNQDSPLTTKQRASHFHEDIDDSQDSCEYCDLDDFHHLLLPDDDPLLDNSFDDAPLSPSSLVSSPPESASSWEDQPSDKNDDDTEEISFSDDSRFIDSGWGGECLRETEDIDFEFVYALHTFVATVEGQANATKGDTMVLLDDSNSYWWLVKVVKDSSIGYLPAEHIETPTERLARLNKHRNIDLSQTMLGDNPEKTKNPLKKAMRRRNAKTVQFAAPQYFDPSDVEYSSDDEEQEDGEYLGQEEGAEMQDQDQGGDVDESATVEPLKTRSDPREPAGGAITDPISQDAGIDESVAAENLRTSSEILEQSDEGTPGQPGRRPLRNTDSFFKDDTLETRKINLTPSLLRDDSSGSTVKSNEVKELKPRGSLDSLEKIASAQEKAKEDKKRKEKKGMLNGLFKRKDKKSKGQDDEIEDGKKSFEESRQSPQPKESSESISQDVQPPKANAQPQPQRQTSKLQKSPPVSRSTSANRSNSSSRSQTTKSLAPRDEPAVTNPVLMSEHQKAEILETQRGPQLAPKSNGSVRVVQQEQRKWSDDTPSPVRSQGPEQPREDQVQPESPKGTGHGMPSQPMNPPQLSPLSSELRAEQVRMATQRMAMDDSDSSSDTEETSAVLTNHEEPRSASGTNEAPRERLSESPVQVPSQDAPATNHLPPLMIDTSSQEDPSTSPVSPLSSPELIEAPREGNIREATPASTAQSSTSTPTWSDASLRAYLEDDTDIRDLLVVVHDKSDVKPAQADHPIVKNLFKEENLKLGEISSRLDGLLGDFLARKSNKWTTIRFERVVRLDILVQVSIRRLYEVTSVVAYQPRLADSNLDGAHCYEVQMATVSDPSASQPVSSDTLERSNSTSHKRTYQACIPCRRRKVRCDLGPVDEPHDPPCVRCRRESKECYFSATRRKRKAEDGEGLVVGCDDLENDYANRNSRRNTSQNHALSLSRDKILHQPRRSPVPGSRSNTPPMAGYNLKIREPAQPSNSYYGDMGDGSTETSQDREVTNETAAALFQSPINMPGDALHLLLEASGRSEDINRQQKRRQSNQHDPTMGKHLMAPQKDYDGQRQYAGLAPVLQGQPANIDPAIITGNVPDPDRSTFDSYGAINVWSRLRFVRAGWLTATEAMSYIDYFYRHLAPLTPISPPDFRPQASHVRLLSEEPMLTITLLTIAARYKNLTGPGGQSRSFVIHEKLWNYLQNMITRMFWGQEQFGGGFCGAGSRKVDQKVLDRGGLRSLGTIESLLLLSEFHPRSMHFPPGDDDNEILAPLEEDLQMTREDIRDMSFAGENPISGWTEPALRSDRMCWSLISTAYALAYELGLFGNFCDGTRTTADETQRKDDSPSESQRTERVKRLLFIYVTQTSGRLGFPSMFPDHVHECGFMDVGLANLEGQPKTKRNSVDTIQQCWAEITTVMKSTNSKLFPSKEKTRELIRSGEYISVLQEHLPIQKFWKAEFDTLDVEKIPKVILSMEYEYTRVYANSLALQAVLEQWASKVGIGRSGTSSLVALYRKNEYFINECVDASRNLLRHLVEGLLPDDFLKHAPTRTYFRILSGAMFLLKTFALGAKEDEVKISLDILDATIKALRTSVVDDVHLCLRIADLLERLTSSIRNKFVRLAAPSRRQKQYPQTVVMQDANGPNAAYSFSNSGNMGGVIDSIAGIATSNINAQDSNITIMPPPNDLYNNYSSNPPNNPFSQPFTSSHQQQSHLYPATNSDDTTMALSSQVSEEDWLTLNLNPLLSDPTGGGFGNGEPGEHWFGDFGPEIINNLEVLGRLVDGHEPGMAGGGAGRFG